jgi:hypothetical protein
MSGDQEQNNPIVVVAMQTYDSVRIGSLLFIARGNITAMQRQPAA